jgi:hypothetical protein
LKKHSTLPGDTVDDQWGKTRLLYDEIDEPCNGACPCDPLKTSFISVVTKTPPLPIGKIKKNKDTNDTDQKINQVLLLRVIEGQGLSGPIECKHDPPQHPKLAASSF